MDDFEQFLKNQPLRAVPPEWRSEILAAASQGGRKEIALPAWRGWLWPSPYAWGALAAVWVVILGLNIASQREMDRNRPRGPMPTEQEMVAMFSEYRLELEEFSSVAQPRPAALPIKQPDAPGAWLEYREPEADKVCVQTKRAQQDCAPTIRAMRDSVLT